MRLKKEGRTVIQTVTDSYTVRFGTSAPLTFTQTDKRFEAVGLDKLELAARFAGVAEVTGYDESAYADGDAVKAAIRENAAQILQRCLTKLPDGANVLRGNAAGILGDLFDKELAAMGITAKTEIVNITPTDEAKALVQSAAEQLMKTQTTRNFGWDHINMIDDYIHPVDPSFRGMLDMIQPDSVDVCAPDTKVTDNLPMGQYCRKCGCKRAANEKFCPECGEAFG